MRKKFFPRFLLALILFIAIVNVLANEFSWYWRISWLDMPMHFLGGLWVGSTALWFYSRGKIIKTAYVFLISFGAVLVIGGLWEIFEFNIDTFIAVSNQNGLLDTASDLIFDILGGTVAVIYFTFKKQKNGK